MKKLLITSLLFCSFLSCKSQNKSCEQSLINWRNYEDTIQIEFVGIDSSIFKGKDYKHIADSLFWNHNEIYHRYDIKNIKTGEIHRVIFERQKYKNGVRPFNVLLFERVG
jgi:hypothetical protein